MRVAGFSSKPFDRESLAAANVLVAANQGFFTEEALHAIADTTLAGASTVRTW